jgi:hypothetical protein
MRNLTIDNFENDNKTIAVGDKADAMVRRDKRFWNAYNAERDETKNK